MPKTIYNVIREMALSGSAPAKSIAKAVGKPYSTFMRELNGLDPGAKLGVELLLPLMQLCNSITPLRFLAARMGCRVVSMRELQPDKPTLHEELLDTYATLAEYHKSIMNNESLEKVAELREQLIRQAQEDFIAYVASRGQAGDLSEEPQAD